jgi:hypothetical protein
MVRKRRKRIYCVRQRREWLERGNLLSFLAPTDSSLSTLQYTLPSALLQQQHQQQHRRFSWSGTHTLAVI